MSSRNLMAGEWIGPDGRLHGPSVCECHREHGSTTYLVNARRMIGLIDEAGYALCSRCKARLEDDTKLYCLSCDEMIVKERMAGIFRS